MAIGSMPNLLHIESKNSHIQTTEKGTIKTDPITLATNIAGVFAGGDVVNGGATVVEAIAAGQCAAISIDRFLRGEDMAKERFIIKGMRKEVSYIDPAKEVKTEYRPSPADLKLTKRIKCFDEVVKAYSSFNAKCEAGRCLRCDRKDEESGVQA
jgi:NADPH-dependent glutamate synthase beta subunit-like oxidoreductase